MTAGRTATPVLCHIPGHHGHDYRDCPDLTSGRVASCLDCGKTFDAAGTADLHGMTKGHAITSGRTATPPTCPHGGCCESFGYVISFIEYLLDTLPKESPEWVTAARIMDEVGK